MGKNLRGEDFKAMRNYIEHCNAFKEGSQSSPTQ